MENTEQQPQAAPAQAEAAAPAPAASLDDLTRYLAEFDRETAKPPAAPQQQPTATEGVPDSPAANALTTPANPAQTLDRAIAALQNDTRGTDEMRQAVNQLAGVVQNIQMQQALERDRTDFQGVLTKAGKVLEAQGLPANEEEIQRWILSEISLNPELVSAFDRRYLSPEDQRRYARQQTKAFERLAESIKHRPDPEVTAERNAIVAAVTKGGSYKAPKEKPIDYGSLSDAEYRAELKKLGIT